VNVLFLDHATELGGAEISLLELLPGFDTVPFFTLTWVSWYTYRRRRMRKTLEKELEKWL